MSVELDAFQAILATMRQEFLAELPERCFGFDDLILRLEKTRGDGNVFDELYRGVHSLKGSGGTYGLGVVTTVCHQLENLLSEAKGKGRFDAEFAAQALAHVDLLRRVTTLAGSGRDDFTEVLAQLDALRRSGLQNRKSVLVVESSRLMAGMYKQALSGLPLQLTFIDNGLLALERLLHVPFDLVIVGRELKELNGVAMMAAMRASHTPQRDVPAVLVSSNSADSAGHVAFNAQILRDQDLAQNLLRAVKKILG